MILYYSGIDREKTQENVPKTMQIVRLEKKNEKNRKKCLTFLAMSGILTKLFDGDEVQKWRTKKFEKTWKSTWQNELSLI